MVTQAERREATVAAIIAAARKLFGKSGFDATSIDDIAADAGVAKGAVYHHFSSKEEVFARVLEGVQEELALRQMRTPRRETAAAERMAAGVLWYLHAACEPGIKQILLIDGPAVLGWNKWREVDMRYFGAMTRMAVEHLLPNAAAPKIDAVAHLLLGAVTEAALVCATAANPKKAAREMTDSFRGLLRGLS